MKKIVRILLVAVASLAILEGVTTFKEDEAVSVSVQETTTIYTSTEKKQTSVNSSSDQVTDITSDGSTAANVSNNGESAADTSVPTNSSFSVKYIDVGQADSALVSCDGHYMLIDGGNRDDSNVIYSVLKKANVDKLDIVVGTHAHEDHIGGLPGAFNYTTADLTLCPVKSYDSSAFKNFKEYAEKKGNGIKVPSVGDTYSLGSASIKILGVNSASDANNTSIVLMIKYGETSFLFAGDAEREAEEVILDSGYDLSATVLKVGHHGSDSSTTYHFLNEVMPKYAVICVGKGNSYGHPTDSALSKLKDADVEVYRTDLNGDITITSDGKNVSVSTNKTASQNAIFTSADNSASSKTNNTSSNNNSTNAASSSSSASYIINSSTGKFHYSTCSSVKKMKASNKVSFTGSRDELVGQGYSPCGICNP